MMKIYALVGALRTISLILAGIIAAWMVASLLLAVLQSYASAYLFSVVGTISLIGLGFAALGVLLGLLKSSMGRSIDREHMGIIQSSQRDFKAALDQIATAAQTPLAR